MAKVAGFFDSITNAEPKATLLSASPKPELRLTSKGRTADIASSPDKPKPSVLEGMTTR